VDVSTVRRWVVRFGSGDSDVRDRPRSGRPCTAVSPRNAEQLDQLIRADYDQGTVYGAECRLQCAGNDVGNVGISQSLCQVGPTDAHTGT
jgi:hypothetical protein